MPPGQRKLRDSCDSCHIAKVKCIKTKTGECLRCASAGSLCSFSPSDRRGKPRGAKNKCNRSPQAHPRASQPRSPDSKSNALQSQPPLQPPTEGLSSPDSDFEKYLQVTSQGDFNSGETPWVLPTSEDTSQCFINIPSSDNELASTVHMDWIHLDVGTPSIETPIQSQPQLPCATKPYSEPGFRSPQALPVSVPSLDENVLVQDLKNRPLSQPADCKCYPTTLQSLFTLYCQQIAASSGDTIPFDASLLISNEAIERCHAMLLCRECALGADPQKSSGTMLMLAGAIDGILTCYENTCTAYLDFGGQEALIFSSEDGITAPTFFTPHQVENKEAKSYSHTTRPTCFSSISAPASGAACNAATQLSVGTYRIGGEDGYHLKVEILRLELRKVERLWTIFRDKCGTQQSAEEDKNDSLHLALIGYLAKKMRRVSNMLEMRRRTMATAW